MTTADVYEIIVTLMEHAQEDLINEADSAYLKNFVDTYSSRMLDIVYQNHKYITGYEVGTFEPIQYHEHQGDTDLVSVGSTRPSDASSCELLLVGILDKLNSERGEIVSDVTTRYEGDANASDFISKAEEITNEMVAVVEKNSERIIRSCVLPG